MNKTAVLNSSFTIYHFYYLSIIFTVMYLEVKIPQGTSKKV